MSLRFLADENIDVQLIGGLLRREPAFDIVDVKSIGLRGTKDPALLDTAAQHDRILLTDDRNTMRRHLNEPIATGKFSPGVFVLPNRKSSIGEIIDWLVLVWSASEPDEWPDRVHFMQAYR